MNWKFIKTNWFQLSLGLILVTAFAHKKMHLFDRAAVPDRKEQKSRITEKFSEAVAASTAESAGQMGLLPGGSQQAHALPTIDDATALAFLKRFSNVAVGEHTKFGIPASVILACAYVNSSAGQRPLAQQANNFFALSCTSTWDGKSHSLNGRCFRKYDRPWDSFRDFSNYLTSQQWFAGLRKSAGLDSNKWISALAGHGLSDVTNFEGEVKKVVETYRLFELDGK